MMARLSKFPAHLIILLTPSLLLAGETLRTISTGEEAFLNGQLQESLELYSKYSNSIPTNWQVFYNIGIINLNLKDYNHAEAAFRRSINLDSTVTWAWWGLGTVMARLGR